MATIIYGRKNCFAVSVTSVATAISTNATRVGLVFKNNSTVTVYLGRDSSVTTSTGFPLAPGETIQDTDSYDGNHGSVDTWYGIVSSGTADIRVVEFLSQ